MLAGFASASIGVVLYFLPQALTVRLLSVLRIFHYPAGWGVLRFIEDNPLLPMRAISTSIDPNVLGGLLILVASLTAPQLFTERPILKKILVVPILAAMLSCLLLTFSRGALVGLGAACLFLGATRYRRLFIAMVLVGLLILILPQTRFYVQRFIAAGRVQDLATQMRMGEYKDAFKLISRYPWFGVGFSGAPSIDLYIGVSSVYLLMAENMGLVGLASFLLIMALYFLHGWGARRALAGDPEGEAILLGLLAAIAGAMVGGVVDHYFFNLDFPHSVSLFWLYVGLTIATIKVYLPSQEPETGPADPLSLA
jgi:O-antigen ligase